MAVKWLEALREFSHFMTNCFAIMLGTVGFIALWPLWIILSL
jgi:hypothetical protein